MKELNQKEKMPHNHGSLNYPILFKCKWGGGGGGGWGGGGGGGEIERENAPA